MNRFLSNSLIKIQQKSNKNLVENVKGKHQIFQRAKVLVLDRRMQKYDRRRLPSSIATLCRKWPFMHENYLKKYFWRSRDSNPRPFACEANTLPLSYTPNFCKFICFCIQKCQIETFASFCSTVHSLLFFAAISKVRIFYGSYNIL